MLHLLSIVDAANVSAFRVKRLFVANCCVFELMMLVILWRRVQEIATPFGRASAVEHIMFLLLLVCSGAVVVFVGMFMLTRVLESGIRVCGDPYLWRAIVTFPQLVQVLMAELVQVLIAELAQVLLAVPTGDHVARCCWRDRQSSGLFLHSPLLSNQTKALAERDKCSLIGKRKKRVAETKTDPEEW